MAITEPTTDIDEEPLRVPRAWIDDRAQVECVRPDACLIDHDN